MECAKESTGKVAESDQEQEDINKEKASERRQQITKINLKILDEPVAKSKLLNFFLFELFKSESVVRLN